MARKKAVRVGTKRGSSVYTREGWRWSTDEDFEVWCGRAGLDRADMLGLETYVDEYWPGPMFRDPATWERLLREWRLGAWKLDR